MLMSRVFSIAYAFESYNTVTRILYTGQNRLNGLQKRFGVIRKTPLREISNFIVASERKTGTVLGMVHFGYQ